MICPYNGWNECHISNCMAFDESIGMCRYIADCVRPPRPVEELNPLVSVGSSTFDHGFSFRTSGWQVYRSDIAPHDLQYYIRGNLPGSDIEIKIPVSESAFNSLAMQTKYIDRNFKVVTTIREIE